MLELWKHRQFAPSQTAVGSRLFAFDATWFALTAMTANPPGDGEMQPCEAQWKAWLPWLSQRAEPSSLVHLELGYHTLPATLTAM